ncbi:hypothetical protein HNO88_004396 [Novosphingobium chloroacetimidivorans]|uniref:Uncharacterized protein n=1 Tax=Novosphingobium chloroacetimidivorans TaxID=1428314 RepID=A0A7W7KFD4_9SPHN|nr:hypothetical protein [Novosphingobium chloroacetimidivorans]MBB4861048.1 hypothetical protein [Novosphingobium chloroacetimidivorans]
MNDEVEISAATGMNAHRNSGTMEWIEFHGVGDQDARSGRQVWLILPCATLQMPDSRLPTRRRTERARNNGCNIVMLEGGLFLTRAVKPRQVEQGG